MKVLFITKSNLDGIGGGAFASRAYCRALSEIFDGNIDICIADNCGVGTEIKYNQLYLVKERDLLQKILSVFSFDMHRLTKYAKKILKTKQYDICILDSSTIAGTLVKYANKRKIKTITFHHNYEPDYFKTSIASIFSYIFFRVFLPIVKHNEKTAYINSKINLFITEVDKILFEKIYGTTPSQNEVIGCFEYITDKNIILPPCLSLKKVDSKKS